MLYLGHTDLSNAPSESARHYLNELLLFYCKKNLLGVAFPLNPSSRPFYQAQPQLNSTQPQLKLRLRLALVPVGPATRPPNHPPGTVVSETTSSIFQDYLKTK